MGAEGRILLKCVLRTLGSVSPAGLRPGPAAGVPLRGAGDERKENMGVKTSRPLRGGRTRLATFHVFNTLERATGKWYEAL